MSKKVTTPQADRVELSVFPSEDSEWVELARTKNGTLFEKHILNKGILIHPVTKAEINIDDEFISKLRKNFDDGICDIVQVPLADAQNLHSEDPDRNVGEVVEVRERNGKVYAVIDARRADAKDKMGKTWLGASAMLSTNYTDTRTGEKVGPTLLHVAITNRPYVTGLEDYKELISASNSSEDTDIVVYTAAIAEETQEITEVSEELQEPADSLIDETLQASTPTEEIPMTLDELIAALLENHGIDVEALQAQAEEASAATELSNQLATQLAETLELSSTDNTVDTETLVGAIAELAQEKVSLSARIETLEKDRAGHIVQALINEGYILPHQKDTYVDLRLTNPEMFDKLIPSEPLVKLGSMAGQEQAPAAQQEELDIDAEVERYTKNFAK